MRPMRNDQQFQAKNVVRSSCDIQCTVHARVVDGRGIPHFKGVPAASPGRGRRNPAENIRLEQGSRGPIDHMEEVWQL
jgi:hypothetical protein